MFTIEIKPGYFWHGYFDRDQGRWQDPEGTQHAERSIEEAREKIGALPDVLEGWRGL